MLPGDLGLRRLPACAMRPDVRLSGLLECRGLGLGDALRLPGRLLLRDRISTVEECVSQRRSFPPSLFQGDRVPTPEPHLSKLPVPSRAEHPRSSRAVLADCEIEAAAIGMTAGRQAAQGNRLQKEHSGSFRHHGAQFPPLLPPKWVRCGGMARDRLGHAGPQIRRYAGLSEERNGWIYLSIGGERRIRTLGLSGCSRLRCGQE
jgi:hypothetical protein